MKEFVSIIFCISFSIVSILSIYAQRKKKFALFSMNFLVYILLMCISVFMMKYNLLYSPISFYCSDGVVRSRIDHYLLFTIMILAFIVVNKTLITVLFEAEKALKKDK